MSENASKALQAVQNMGTGVSNVYSTIIGDTPEARIAILEAVTNAEPIADHLDEIIQLKDVVVQATEIGQEDGSERDALRIILIDSEGKSYAAVSDGLFKAMQNMFAILGNPNTWTEPLPVKVVEVRGRRGFKFFTIKIAK